ncbi:MAG: hypothetical protein JXC85_00710 [Candidatus Aenigmarchaeota archaeon]|nr:hypothetical protein [Candidatus Aenigmarchaeota archaeon]
MDLVDELKEKLKRYSREQIIFTTHARIRAIQRGIDLEDIVDNIIRPDKLDTVIRQKADRPDEEKFDCYFIYSGNLCHRYVLILNKKIIICTVIKINRRWQRRVEKHARV